MRIVYFNHNVVGTGTYLRAYRLGCEVARAGHDVTVVTTSARARYGVTRRHAEGVTVVEVPDLFWGRGRTGWDPFNTLVRCVGAVAGPVDLIHAFDSRPAVILPALYLRRRTNARLVLDWADWWGRGGTIHERTRGASRYVIEPVETWFEERFRTEADLTTTICRALQERVVRLGVPSHTTRLVPNGCSAVSMVNRQDARRRLNVPEDAPLLVHLGASFERDITLMLEAFAEVRRRLPKAALVFAGKLPARVDGEPGVHALGRVPDLDVVNWLSAADACVLPLCDTIANRGRWPSKVNEYLAAGRAIAMTDVGDVAHWIRDRRCGVVAPAEPVAFANAIVELMDDEPRRAAAETCAAALAAGELAWSRIASDVLQFYQSAAPLAAVKSA